MMERFPNITNPVSDNNPAIKLFGRRFYKDQTPVEYLAEFLLVFASAKVVEGTYKYQFPLITDKDKELRYWPQVRLPLKFFSFFATSKLETRYDVHSMEFRKGIEMLQNQINAGSDEKRDLTVRLLQSLFSGFVGVAKNRTWATQTFLPASDCLLAKEVDWRHTQAVAANPKDWDATMNYFDTGAHNFMARGGELIYLQLLNLFSQGASPAIEQMRALESYKHLTDDTSWKQGIETNLREMLSKVENHIGGLASFIEECWKDYQYRPSQAASSSSSLGWVPSDTATEAYLLASEMLNIVTSSHGSLQKVEFLQDLCCLHVLRTLCFRARRLEADTGETDGFIGNFAWVVCARNSETAGEGRKLSIEGYQKIEQMLYRVLRIPQIMNANLDPAKGDDHVYKLFRKLGKEIGLIVPRTGRHTRFVLPNSVIRLLVASLIKPGERVRLSEFYRRIFAHYGIAIRSTELAVALSWLGNPNSVVAVAQDTSWFEDELQRGGFLIALSDAVSIVWNPYTEKV
jgi:hypothetical protein